MAANNLSTKAYNAAVGKWARNTKAAAIAEGRRLGIKSEHGTLDNMRNSYGRRNGEIIRVSFGMKRHLIYVHKGVGRGWPIVRQGGVGAALSGGRKPKPFLNNIIDKRINMLADDVAKFRGDIVVDNIKIR